MSTSKSPLWQLRKEAKRAAHHLKRPGLLPDKPVITFGIAMDDKFITVKMARTTIISSSEASREEMIFGEMQKEIA